MDRLRSSVERALHTHAKESSVIRPRRHVVHIAAVADILSVASGLRLILVVRAVEATVEVILIVPP